MGGSRKSKDMPLQERIDYLFHEYELLSQVVNVSADAIILIDHDQKILSFNEGARRIFGYSTEVTVGKTVDMHAH
ncbi:MAG: PAS domain S-box protein [Proteobacteria bacterium]|nr:PAS domain S-box protein [Pseudomonadota bacterium]